MVNQGSYPGEGDEDPWTISPEDHERSGDEEGIDAYRPAPGKDRIESGFDC
jgi:hypothetical protein